MPTPIAPILPAALSGRDFRVRVEQAVLPEDASADSLDKPGEKKPRLSARKRSEPPTVIDTLMRRRRDARRASWLVRECRYAECGGAMRLPAEPAELSGVRLASVFLLIVPCSDR